MHVGSDADPDLDGNLRMVNLFFSKEASVATTAATTPTEEDTQEGKMEDLQNTESPLRFSIDELRHRT